MELRVKSITAGNHSILALSKVRQPAVARSCIRRATVSFISDRKPLIQSRYANIIDDRLLVELIYKAIMTKLYRRRRAASLNFPQ